MIFLPNTVLQLFPYTATTSTMDLPRCLNKSQSDLEGLQKEDLIDMLMDSNAFILQHLLNENTMLKEQLQVMVASTSAQVRIIIVVNNIIFFLEYEWVE